MAQFPLDATHILVLAETMIKGLRDNHTVFPSPPVSAVNLQALLDEAVAALDEQVATQAAAKAATERKTVAFTALGTSMKNDISYAEFTVTTPAELGLIGWGPKAEPEPLAARSLPCAAGWWKNLRFQSLPRKSARPCRCQKSGWMRR